MSHAIHRVLIVDDASEKLRVAEDIVHHVFGGTVDIRLVYVNGRNWDLDQVVAEVLNHNPDLLILDSEIDPGHPCKVIQGSMVARELNKEYDGLCLTRPIVVANTHGGTGWGDPLTQRFFKRAAGVTLGAGDDTQLRQVLEQIRDGRVDT